MDWRSILLGLFFAAAWSSAFTSARIVVADAPPFLALSVRFLVSGAIALAIGRALGQRISLTRRQWLGVLVFGICQNALYLGLNFEALRTVEASLAVVVASLMVAVLAVRDQPWVELVPLGLTIIITHLGLLFWELRHISSSLAFPGLKPQATPNPYLPVADDASGPSTSTSAQSPTAP